MNESSDMSFEKDVLQEKGLVLVDFSATWCGPCKAIQPKLEELSSEMKEVKILKVDVDNNPQTPSEYGVRSVPTLILFKEGKPVDQLLGNQSKEDIEAMITKHS